MEEHRDDQLPGNEGECEFMSQNNNKPTNLHFKLPRFALDN
jgi:hypothetical protein